MKTPISLARARAVSRFPRMHSPRPGLLIAGFRAGATAFVVCLLAGPGNVMAQTNAAAPRIPKAAASAEDPVLELPTFKVDETANLPPRESWRYGTIPGFEIFSDASDDVTREWVEDVQTVLQLGEVVWPVKLATNRRTVLILCRNAKSCADFGFIDYYRKTTLLTRISDDSVMDWEQHFFIKDTSAGLYRRDSDRWRRIAGLYYYQSGQIEPRPPGWIASGGSQILLTAVKVEKDALIIGGMTDIVREAFSLSSRRSFRHLSETFDMSPLAVEQSIVVSEKYWRPGAPVVDSNQPGPSLPLLSFVQLCLLDKPDRYEAGLVQFVNRGRLVPVTEELFQECFGRSLAELDKETTEYEERVSFMKQAPVKTIKGIKFHYAPLTLRDATDAEVGRIKGEALAMLENPQIPPRAMLRAPYVRGERDPQLLAAIGLHEHKLGNDGEARKFLEQAVREKVDRPRAYLELVDIRLRESVATPQGPDGMLSAGQMAPLMELLATARALSPAIPEVYDMIAKVAAHSDAPAMRRYLAVIDEGLRLFPYHAELACQGAAAFARAGRYNEAAKLIDHGLVRFRYYEPVYRERLKQLQATLPPAPGRG